MGSKKRKRRKRKRKRRREKGGKRVKTHKKGKKW